MVGRIPAFQPGDPGSIPRGVRDLNLYPRIGRVSFFCVLSCVVSRDGPDILLTVYSEGSALVYVSSVLILSLWLSLHTSDPWAFELIYMSWERNFYIRESKY